MSPTESLAQSFVPELATSDAVTFAEQTLKNALPQVVRDGIHRAGPLSAVIETMVAMLAPRSALITASPQLIDPVTAPEPLLPWLSGWYGWDWLFIDPVDPRRLLSLEVAFPPGVERLRALLTASGQLAPLRGQSEGLRLTLQIASGLSSISIKQQTERQHLQVRAPNLPAGWESWLRRMVAAERPLHLTWDLQLAPHMDKSE